MGYKQTNNPFSKLNKSFTNPKRREVRNAEALRWNMPDFNSIIEKKADGSTITEDNKTENTTGTDKEGTIPKSQEGQDGINADVITKLDQADAREEQAQAARQWKEDKKSRKKHERQNRRDVRQYSKGIKKGEIDADDEGYKEAVARQAYYDTQDTKGKDWHEVEADFQTKKSQLEKYEEDKEKDLDEMYDIPEMPSQQTDEEYYDRGDYENSYEPDGQAMYKNKTMKQINSKGRAFPMVAHQQQTNPYGQEEPAPNRAGRSPQSNQLSNDPNINQPLNKIPNSTFETNQKFSEIASSAGNPSNELEAMENVAGHTPAYGQPAVEKKKTKTTYVGKSVGTNPTQRRDNAKELEGKKGDEQPSNIMYNQMLPEIEVTSKGSGMYDGPSNEKGKVKLDGKEVTYNKGGMRENLTKQGVISKDGKITPEIMNKAEEGDYGELAKKQANFAENAFGFTGTAMVENDPLKKIKSGNTYKLNKPIPKKPQGEGEEKKIEWPFKKKSEGAGLHTKVTSKNVKAAEKDDAAHASYLKRDVKDIQKSHMSQAKKDAWETADEKHISKLYGDLKYDHKHHGRKYDNV